MWTVLYAQMAVVAWLVWRADPGRSRSPLTAYGGQLALNLGWTLLFFGLRRPGLAVLDICVLWLAIVVTMTRFRRQSPLAFWLLWPYLLWVTFAATLNIAIWRRNPAG